MSSSLDQLEADALHQRVLADPWVMHLVVERKREPARLQAAALAARACLLARAHWGESEEWVAWMQGGMRKVCLRARPAQWTRLLAREDFLLVEDERARMLVSAPALRSERARLLSDLQVWSARSEAHQIQEEEAELALAVPEALEVSDGKLAAQAGHAALMLEREFSSQLRVNVQALSPSEFQLARANEHAVVVRDAGLTEIAPGTETVLAWPLRPA